MPPDRCRTALLAGDARDRVPGAHGSQAPPQFVSVPYLDANVIIRLTTGDDPAKKLASRMLFRCVERSEIVLATPVTTIADVVFVLASRQNYSLPRSAVRDLLVPLLLMPAFRVPDIETALRALDVFASTRLDFGDAMIVAAMEAAGSGTLVSYDRDFDAIPGVIRVEP